MLIQIIKEIPTKKNIFIEKGSVALVESISDSGYWIRTYHQDRLFIKHNEYKIFKGEGMKVIELAYTIKYLECVRWQRLIKPTPIDKFDQRYYLINEFPFNSALCYIFRGNLAKSPKKEIKCCFCPLQPAKHINEWGITDKDVCIKGKRVNCVLDKNNKHIDSHTLLERAKYIPIERIIKYLKKVKIPKYKIRMLSMAWHLHIWHKVTRGKIDSVGKKLISFQELF